MGTGVKPNSIVQARKYVEKYVVYHDRGIIVSNKPKNMICQLSSSQSVKSLKFNILCKGIQQHLDLPGLPYPVHRLDQNTTGALVLGRTQDWARNLSHQFLHRTIGKTYLALVYGRKNQFSGSFGVIENRLGKVEGRVRFDPHGTQTKTEWELLGSSPKVPLSLMRLKLYTGHKHQLRFHLANCLEAPVVGDDLYKIPHLNELVQQTITIPKKVMFLHSHELSLERWTKFGHTPRSKYTQTFRVPVPTKFRVLCRDAQIPVDETFLKEGAMLINGAPWTTPDQLHHEEEKCWISPKLLPNSKESPDEGEDED